MKRERMKELLPMMQAYADGKEIEYFYNNRWHTSTTPIWEYNTKYRIKPEPKVVYVPYHTITHAFGYCYSTKEAAQSYVTACCMPCDYEILEFVQKL